jgi:hypothetical protein
MLSCQQTQNVIDGKKRIILNPNESQRKDFETVVFAENEVYGIDILISSGEDGKVIHNIGWSVFWLIGDISGSLGRITDDNLPEGFGCLIPTKNEEFPCHFFRSTKESWGLPI